MNRLFLLISILAVACIGDDWSPADLRLPTRWSAEVSPTHAHPEYPRPMMRRASWKNLNGLWDYAVVGRETEPGEYDGKILVPYPIESALSGVARTVGEDRRLWYRRSFEIPSNWTGQRVLLHFEAADWETRVFVNDHPVGLHRGGYDPFTFDITGFLTADRHQELSVSVWDPTDSGTQPRGKQVSEPGGIFYTSVTGIWQTVWLEPVPDAAIGDLTITPDIDSGRVEIVVEGDRTVDGDRVEVSVSATGSVVATASGDVDTPIFVDLPDARLWSPDDPFLYDVELKLNRNDETLDTVLTYFGMRKTSVGRDEDGVTRLLLNNEFVFQMGPLDQGYWPDGLYTAPTEEAMVYDIEMLKAMGFNMLRKHVKVEPRTFYSWCDQLGLLIWQDMPNADIPLETRDSDTPTSEEATDQFEAELTRVIGSLRNHPSIVMWVPFNEGWGQYESGRIVELVRETDPSRLVNHASGWYERGAGDVVDWHSYPAPNPPEPEVHRAAVQGEYGGLGFNVPGHMWEEEGWGYALFPDRESLVQRFEDLLLTIHDAASNRGLSAAVYTQTTDIETENNGLMTYDREIMKIDVEAISLANRGYFPPRVERRTSLFLDRAMVAFAETQPGTAIRYSTDGSEPNAESLSYAGPFEITESTTIRARSFWPNGMASRVSSFVFTRTEAAPSVAVNNVGQGLLVDYYEHDGSWRALPAFDSLTSATTSVVNGVNLTMAGRADNFALRFRGFIEIPEDGVYGFFLTSDDGSRLSVGSSLIVDNDGVHGNRTISGYAALAAGMHSIELVYFQGRGGKGLSVEMDGPGIEREEIDSVRLFRAIN